MPKKGQPSKTRPGDKDYTTKRGDKDFHRKGHDVKRKRRPYTKKGEGEGSARVGTKRTGVSKGRRVTRATGTKKGTATLGGKKITFNKGGLHRSMGVPMSYKFKRPDLVRWSKVKVGDSFDFRGKKKKMTERLKKQVVLGMNLMKRS